MGRPKGSKNKSSKSLKHGIKRPEQTLEALKTTMSHLVPSYCKICDRVPFGSIVPLGCGSWRHDGCAIGSKEWGHYYHRQSLKTQQTLNELYNLYYEVKS